MWVEIKVFFIFCFSVSVLSALSHFQKCNVALPEVDISTFRTYMCHYTL